jgi:putative addiction module component (TIGR02574 family)
MTKATLIAEIKKLTPEERLELIGDIWDSLDHLEVTPSREQLAEASRRLEEHRRDPSNAIPVDKVLAELRSLLK